MTDVETINALMWSDRLDDVFAENLKRDPTIYQYFASKEGVLRYFPAHRYVSTCSIVQPRLKLKKLLLATSVTQFIHLDGGRMSTSTTLSMLANARGTLKAYRLGKIF